MLEKLIQFFPKTKAKSSEVNYNFDLIRQSVDELNTWKSEIDTKVTSNLGFNLFDTKVVDHVLTDDAARGWMLQGSLVTKTYISAVDAIKKYYEDGIDTTYRGIECKLASNKMYIADIGKKADIDKLFNDTGVADFYIVDRLNEQFYLPRTKWFHQFTLDTSLVNNYNEAGIPNIVGNTTVWATNYPINGAFRLEQQTGNRLKGGPDDFMWTVSFDASRCNSRYGKSNTVQPTSSLKLLYYKVGDTFVNIDNMLINAEKLLEEKVNEINTAGDDVINNITSYKAESITEIQAQGVESAQLSKDWAIKTDGMVNDEDYSSKYYANKAKEVIPVGGKASQVLTKNSDKDYDYAWADFEGGLTSWGNIYGDIANQTDLNEALNKKLGSGQITNCILEAPNGVATYSGGIVTVKQGLKVLFSNGYNTDGTLKNIEYTVPEDTQYNVIDMIIDPSKDFTFFIPLNKESNTAPLIWETKDVLLHDETDTSLPHIKLIENKWKYTVDEEPYQDCLVIPILTFFSDKVTISNFKTFKPFQAVNYNDTEFMAHQAMPSDIFINLSLQASGATYTAPADGYYVVVMIPTNLDCYFEFLSGTIQNGTYGGATVNYRNKIFCPVKKGQSITIAYRNTGVESFKFVYAQGAR